MVAKEELEKQIGFVAAELAQLRHSTPINFRKELRLLRLANKLLTNNKIHHVDDIITNMLSRLSAARKYRFNYLFVQKVRTYVGADISLTDCYSYVTVLFRDRSKDKFNFIVPNECNAIMLINHHIDEIKNTIGIDWDAYYWRNRVILDKKLTKKSLGCYYASN